MRWLGRGRALYKLSIGGHSALVSKDHVCESGFPVRNPFARRLGYLPSRSLPRAPRGEPKPTALGPHPLGLRGSHAGRPGPGERAGAARREAGAERQARPRPGVGGGGGRRRA